MRAQHEFQNDIQEQQMLSIAFACLKLC